jgi:phosphate transport system substrate-binding protein
VLDGPTLANIYLGTVKKWNDPAIAKLNPGKKLPSGAIALVHRSDGSGTTYNFTYYLADVSADWKKKVGTNTAVQWPAGIGAKGNEGVANNVAQTKGSIGYVEYAYAKQNKLTFTKMVNKAGKTVAPTSEAFQAAAANADWKSQPGFGVILANEPGDASWPMTAATWILIHKKPADPAAATEALKFFAWSYAKGDGMAKDLDYVPMPGNVVGEIQKMWAAEIKDSSGKPLYVVTH